MKESQKNLLRYFRVLFYIDVISVRKKFRVLNLTLSHSNDSSNLNDRPPSPTFISESGTRDCEESSTMGNFWSARAHEIHGRRISDYDMIT